MHAFWAGNLGLFLQLVLGTACMHIINHYGYLLLPLQNVLGEGSVVSWPSRDMAYTSGKN